MKTGRCREQVREALLEAFTTAQEFAPTVAYADVGVKFENFLAASNAVYDEALYAFLARVESRNMLVQLIARARIDNKGNKKLAAVAAELGLLEEQYKAVIDRDTAQPTFGEAERILFDGFDFEDAGNWFAAMARHRMAVCRVEPQPQNESIEGYGTGFLIAPDVVMTNNHVASAFYEDSAVKKAARVVLRFDFETAPDGIAVNAGIEHHLHPTDWRIAHSPEDELDFALLRLERAAGADVVSGGLRGFLTPTDYSFTHGEGLVILQHPMAAPLKFALGPVDSPPWPADRVQYMVNTQGGSSGSPCFTQQRRVAALHHWDKVTRNQGVLMSSILKHLKELPEAERERLNAAGLARLLA